MSRELMHVWRTADNFDKRTMPWSIREYLKEIGIEIALALTASNVIRVTNPTLTPDNPKGADDIARNN